VKIVLAAVGRPKDRALDDRVADYGRRIVRFGVTWETVEVREVAAGRRYSDDHVREREGRALLETHSGRGTMVALDRGGRGWSSAELADRIERWVSPTLTLVIGGPLGLHSTVLDAADERWSLSPLTLPHELARLVVAEQVYRSLTIVRKVPYHK
jgi:23S rRNA (pseudouridine1915-N3)-methyltransferase